MLAITENGNRAVEGALGRLERAVLDAGARLAPELGVRCAGSELSVVSSAPQNTRKPLVWLPEAALLPLDEVELGLSGDDLEIKSHLPGLTRARRAIWDAKLELYNLTGKIHQHRLTAPCVALIDHPEILDRLVHARMSREGVARGLYRPGSRDRQSYVIRNFFATRTLNIKFPNQPKGRVSVMPVIDFVNHHSQGAGFQGTPRGRIRANGIMMPTARPVTGSRECFARYWYYDAHDTFLGYGFVDESAPVVRSVTMELELDKVGSIHVKADRISQINHKSVDADMADLSLMMPRAERIGENVIAVSHLFIPAGGSRRLLRQVLIGLINALRAGLDEEDQHRIMLDAEEQILAENRRHYEDMAGWLANPGVSTDHQEVLATAQTLTRVQRAKLEKYMALPD